MPRPACATLVFALVAAALVLAWQSLFTAAPWVWFK